MITAGGAFWVAAVVASWPYDVKNRLQVDGRENDCEQFNGVAS